MIFQTSLWQWLFQYKTKIILIKNKGEQAMKKILTLVIMVFFATSSIGFSQMRDGDGRAAYKMPHGKWWRVPAIQEKLKIKPEEQKKLDKIYTESRRKMIDLKATVEKEKLDLEQILDNENFDKKACLKKFQLLQAGKNKLSSERFAFIVEIRELFGQERFSTLSNKHKNFMRKNYKRGGNKCPVSGRNK